LNSRWQAALLLNTIISEGKSISELSFPDALSQELVYGTLRFYFRLEKYLNTLLDDPKKVHPQIYALCLIGLYQLDYLSMATHAVVNETVKATTTFKKPWAKGLVNAVLRRFLREKAEITSQLEKDPVFETAFPLWLIEAIQKAWPNEASQIMQESNQRPPMTLRVNRKHISREAYLKKLTVACTPHPLLPDAITLDTPTAIQALPGFEQGEISVQDAGAQLAACFLNVQSGEKVLDACAAPGGKAAHILQCTPDVDLTLIDVNANRIEKLKKDFSRMQLQANIKVADALAPKTYHEGALYDAILCDAPCSSVGVIRRHPDIKVLRKKDDLIPLSTLQTQMIRTLFGLLKSGGRLLYATCSILPEENENIVARFVKENPHAQVIPLPTGYGVNTSHGIQILPGTANMDGFYYALIQKL